MQQSGPTLAVLAARGAGQDEGDPCLAAMAGSKRCRSRHLGWCRQGRRAGVAPCGNERQSGLWHIVVGAGWPRTQSAAGSHATWQQLRSKCVAPQPAPPWHRRNGCVSDVYESDLPSQTGLNLNVQRGGERRSYTWHAPSWLARAPVDAERMTAPSCGGAVAGAGGGLPPEKQPWCGLCGEGVPVGAHGEPLAEACPGEAACCWMPGVGAHGDPLPGGWCLGDTACRTR